MDEKEPIITEEHVSSESTNTNMSKNQLKKLKKQMKWLETKKERRAAMKEKKKTRRAERREKGENLGPKRKSLKLNNMKNSSCKIRVVLDLSLEEYMSDKDITSLTSQIQHSYSANRKAANPMQLYACSLGGRTQQRLDAIGDYKNWDVHFKTESYMDVFPKESIVYLSSESSNILTTLSEDKVYVIGGLVDHNSHKGLCHRLAEEKGVAHAQLPISEYLHLKGRKVLAINHVFSILRRFTQTNDWKQAFMLELPTRKGFAPIFDEEEQQKSSTDTTTDKEAEVDPNPSDPDEESSLDTSCDTSKATGEMLDNDPQENAATISSSAETETINVPSSLDKCQDEKYVIHEDANGKEVKNCNEDEGNS